MNPNGDKNMTYGMFLNTSHYMKFLMEEIQQMPREEVPPSIKNISEELLTALKKFLNKFQDQAQTSGCDYNEKNQTKNHNEFGNNGADENRFSETQEADKKPDNHHKVWITEEFKSLIQINLNRDSPDTQTQKFYCRPCNLVIYSRRSWKTHLSTDKKHLSFMKNINFKNYEITCTKCIPSIIVLGTLNIMKKYIEYHNEVLHSDEPPGSMDWKKTPPINILVKRIDPPVQEEESNSQLSRASSTLSLQSGASDSYSTTSAGNSISSGNHPSRPRRSRNENKPGFYKKKAPQNTVEKQEQYMAEGNIGLQVHDNLLPESQASTDVHVGPTNQLPRAIVDPVCENDGPMSKFYDGLQAVETYFNSYKEIRPCNFCVLCNVYYLSAFDWDDHEDSPEHRRRMTDSCIWKTCDHCLMKLFGEPATIDKLFKSVRHSNLDDLVYQNYS